MLPIRKGEGTGLSVPGFAEVRKGDGTVLWSAGAEIPDSEVLQDDGTWSVHQRPRAIRQSDTTLIGSVSSTGTIQVAAYDHTNGTVESGSPGSVPTIDDHSSPALYLRSDDRIIAFWNDRGTDDDILEWAISDNALDPTTWGTVNSFQVSEDAVDYPQPMDWNGDLRLYYRVGGAVDGNWKYRDSTDDGASFGTEYVLEEFSDEYIYLHTYPDRSQANDRVHFALGDHRMENTSIRHWYLEDGTYYTSDGTAIQDADDVSSGGSTTVDDYEDGDISEYSGDTGAYTVQSGTVIEGTQTLEGTATDQFNTIVSESGLSAYPSAGDTWRFYFRSNVIGSGSGNNTEIRFFWCSQSTTEIADGYNINIKPEAGSSENFRIRKREEGSETTLDTETNVPFSDNTTYYVEVTHGTDGSISAQVFDTSDTAISSEITSNDSTYTSGGIQIFTRDEGDGGHTAYYDDIRIEGGSSGGPLTDIADVTTVFDGTATGNNPSKQYDLVVDGNGNPHVAFTEHVSTGTGGGDGDYRARWAGWNGSGWDVGAEVTPMGGALPENFYYEGGLSLDEADPTTVYVSVEQDNRNYQIQEWDTDDSGASWSKNRDLSEDGTVDGYAEGKRGRPISPRNHDGTDLAVLWWGGRYSDFDDYETDVFGLTE